MEPGRDRTRDPWISSQTRICSQTRYRLRYGLSLDLAQTLFCCFHHALAHITGLDKHNFHRKFVNIF